MIDSVQKPIDELRLSALKVRKLILLRFYVVSIIMKEAYINSSKGSINRLLLVALLVFFFSISAKGQSPQFKFYGERNNQTVSLAWLPEVWPTSLEGVIIKRKEVDGLWELVTPTPVVPSSFSGKDLTNIESLSSERLRLADKLDSMITNNQAKPVSQKEYYEEILQNDASLKGIAFIFALDFDLILLNGFGCTDRDLGNGIVYKYGLFPVISGEVSPEPIATFVAPALEKPDLDLAMAASIEVIGNNKNLRLHWKFDLDEFIDKKIKGFDIYEIGENGSAKRLNDNVIWITSKDNPADLSYIVAFPETDVEFLAVPLSYFGASGEGTKTSFSPAAYKIVLPPLKLLSSIKSEQMLLKWTLDHAYDSLLEKFSILKKEIGENFDLLVDLDPKAREFNATLNQDGEQSQFKIVAQTKTQREVWSNVVSINYIGINQVPVPFNLQGGIVEQDGNPYIELSWNYPRFDDSISFRVFTDGPDGDLIYDSSLPKDLTSPFLIEIKKSRGQFYNFAVQARAVDRSTSPLSNRVQVLAPSNVLPPVSITNFLVEGSNVEIEWHFTKGIADLKGFRVMLDGQVMKLEDELSADLRKTKLIGVEQGKHSITVSAITQFGLESTPSQAKNIIVR